MRFNMAIFHPSIEKINQFKVQPTDGERTLLNFLSSILDESFEEGQGTVLILLLTPHFS